MSILPRFAALPDLLRRAEVALATWVSLPEDHPARAEGRAAWKESVSRLVFESNQIEGAGLDLLSTRQALGEFFDGRLQPRSPASIDTILRVDDPRVDAWTRARTGLGLPAEIDDLVLRHGKNRRRFREVRQHAKALEYLREVADGFWARLFRELVVSALLLPETRSEFRDWVENIPGDGHLHPRILAAFNGDSPDREAALPWLEAIQHLHRILMEGQDDIEGEEPGTWARRARHAGPLGDARVFVAPENIEAAMVRLVTDVDKRLFLMSILTTPGPLSGPLGLQRLFVAGGPGGGIELAAELSYRFVAIHPFADGNGRISRLLLNLVLDIAGTPFLTSLRSDSRSKKRYREALHRADRGDLGTYQHLIATAVLEGWARIDQNLATLGLPPLDPGRG